MRLGGKAVKVKTSKEIQGPPISLNRKKLLKPTGLWISLW